MNSTSRQIRRLNIESFFNRRCLWRCYRCCLSCFLLFGQRVSACTFDHLFVRLPSLCLGVCFSFVVCVNISLLFIQLLFFEQCTSVFYFNSHSSFEMHYNIPRGEPNKKSKKTSPWQWTFYLHKLKLHKNIHATRE